MCLFPLYCLTSIFTLMAAGELPLLGLLAMTPTYSPEPLWVNVV